jgi:soluble lytic murein transglycosylase
MALAAYNAGGHRVRRWVDNYGDPRTDDIDPIDWVESIPFSETRNYVQRIIENLQVYRARLNNGEATPLNITQDLSGQFSRDLPALPDDFVAALREAQAMERALEAEADASTPNAPVLTAPEEDAEGGAEGR